MVLASININSWKNLRHCVYSTSGYDTPPQFLKSEHMVQVEQRQVVC